MSKYLGLVLALTVLPVGSTGADEAKKADGAPALSEHLKEFERLLGGVWVGGGTNPEGHAYTVRLAYRPMLDKQFVLLRLDIVVEGNVVGRRASMIGWDAKAGKLKNGHFHADGTYRETTITLQKDDSQRHDSMASTGEKTTSLHKSSFTGKDTWELAITDRKRDGEAQPDLKYVFKRHEKVKGLPTKFASGPTSLKYLEPWKPLVGGTWKSVGGEPTTPEGKKVKGTVAFSWLSNKSFVASHLYLKVDGETLRESVSVIGWDAKAEKLRTWAFNSDGSTDEGTIIPKEGGKLVHAGVDSKGIKRSGTAQFTFPDKNTWVYAITERTEGGEGQPDLNITLKRAE